MSPKSKPVILILEDHSAMRVLYHDLLTHKGYKVVCAPSMKGALQLFEEERSRIVGVISDGNVVEGDLGPLFVECIRRLGFTGPIVASSMSRNLVDELMKAGCNLKVSDKSDAPDILHKALEASQA